jgi:hypothetical protein
MVMSHFGSLIFDPLNDHLTCVQFLFQEDVTPFNHIFLNTFSIV